jgi:hypothetical protein
MSSKQIRRINLFGGPGASKSTTAARLFAELKILGYDVEHITEFVKTMAYEGIMPKSYDQYYIFGEQLHKEDVVLRHVNLIISDSPLLLSHVYAEYYGFNKGTECLLKMANQFEADFPSLNIYLERIGEYNPKGRYQTLEQAKEVDSLILKALKNNTKEHFCMDARSNYEKIVKLIIDKVKKNE